MKFNDVAKRNSFGLKLVLNSYLLSLFGVDSFQGNLAKDDRFSGFEELAKELKASRIEELDENDNSLFYHELKDKLIVKCKGKVHHFIN
jgi:hypothetical protein